MAPPPATPDSSSAPEARAEAGLATTIRAPAVVPPARRVGGSLMRALAVQRRRTLGVGTLAALLAAALAWYGPSDSPPEARARLRFTGESAENVAERRREAAALARDPTVLSAVLHPPELAGAFGAWGGGAAIDGLTDALQVRSRPGEPHLDLVLSGPPLAEKAVLVNALAEAIVREMAARQECRAAADLAAAEQRWHAALEKVAEARGRLSPRAAEGPAALATRHRVALERLAETEKLLLQLAGQKSSLEVELALLRAREKAPPTVPRPGEERAEDAVVAALTQQRTRLLAEIEHTRRLAAGGQTPPTLRRATEELQDVERRLAARRAAAAPGTGMAVPVPSGDVAAAVAVLVQSLAAWTERENVLASEVRRREQEARELAIALREAETAREAARSIETAAAVAEAEWKEKRSREPGAPPLAVEAWAEVPPSPTARRAAFAGAAALSGLVAALLVLVIVEVRAHRVHDPADLAALAGLRVFGTLPEVSALMKRRLAGVGPKPGEAQARLLSEALDTVRTRLLHEAEAQGLQVILVTSAVAAEGKTALASQLAVSLARAWKRALLIDADLRSPGIHRLFDLPREPGFAELLRQEAEADAVIQATPISRLWAIPAGHGDDYALQALTQNVEPLLAELRAQFDVVIIDAPPVLPVADALILGRHADGVLLAVRRGFSQAPAIEEAHGRLRAVGVPVLGAVLAGVGHARYGPVRPGPPDAPRARA